MKIECQYPDIVTALCDDLPRDSLSMSRRSRGGEPCCVIVARGKLDARSLSEAVSKLASMASGLDAVATLRAIATDVEKRYIETEASRR